jgi:hypothetical protein
MLRVAHDSMRTAVIHQHASDTGDRRIADALDVVIGAATEEQMDDQTGDQDAARQSHAGSGHRRGTTRPQVGKCL